MEDTHNNYFLNKITLKKFNIHHEQYPSPNFTDHFDKLAFVFSL